MPAVFQYDQSGIRYPPDELLRGGQRRLWVVSAHQDQGRGRDRSQSVCVGKPSNHVGRPDHADRNTLIMVLGVDLERSEQGFVLVRRALHEVLQLLVDGQVPPAGVDAYAPEDNVPKGIFSETDIRGSPWSRAKVIEALS